MGGPRYRSTCRSCRLDPEKRPGPRADRRDRRRGPAGPSTPACRAGPDLSGRSGCARRVGMLPARDRRPPGRSGVQCRRRQRRFPRLPDASGFQSFGIRDGGVAPTRRGLAASAARRSRASATICRTRCQAIRAACGVAALPLRSVRPASAKRSHKRVHCRRRPSDTRKISYGGRPATRIRSSDHCSA